MNATMTTATLTAHQKWVLGYMEAKNLGAVLFEGEYRFTEAFRRDPDLAERFDKRNVDKASPVLLSLKNPGSRTTL